MKIFKNISLYSVVPQLPLYCTVPSLETHHSRVGVSEVSFDISFGREDICGQKLEQETDYQRNSPYRNLNKIKNTQRSHWTG